MGSKYKRPPRSKISRPSVSKTSTTQTDYTPSKQSLLPAAYNPSVPVPRKTETMHHAKRGDRPTLKEARGPAPAGGAPTKPAGKAKKNAKGEKDASKKQGEDKKKQDKKTAGAGKRTQARQEEPVVPVRQAVPVARLGGIRVRKPEVQPPKMSASQREQVIEQTGFKPRAHHAQIRTQLTRMERTAKTLQRRIVMQVDSAAIDMWTECTARIDQIPGRVAQHVGEVRVAYAAARSEIDTRADDALLAIKAAKLKSEKEGSKAADATKTTNQSLLAQSSDRVKKQYNTFVTKGIKDGFLKAKKEVVTTTTGNWIKHVRGGADTLKTDLIKKKDNDFEAAKREQEVKNIPPYVAPIVKNRQENSQKLLTWLDGTLSVFEQLFFMVVNPTMIWMASEEKNQEKRKASQEKGVHMRIATSWERAERVVELTRHRAKQQLDAAEKSHVSQLRAKGRATQQQLAATASTITHIIDSAGPVFARKYRQQADAISKRFEAKTFYRLDPYLKIATSAADDIEATYAQQEKGLLRRVTQGLSQFRTQADTFEQDLASQTTRALAGAQREKAERIKVLAMAHKAYTTHFGKMDEKAQAEFKLYVKNVEEPLGSPPEQVKARLLAPDKGKLPKGGVGAFTNFKRSIEKSLKAQLLDPYKTFKKKTFAQRHEKTIKSRFGQPYGNVLNRKANAAYDAMEGVGTDEVKLMDALRGVTAKGGDALSWKFRKNGWGSLRGWIKSELKDGVTSNHYYDAAIKHLQGKKLEAAMAELKAADAYVTSQEDQEHAMRVYKSLNDKELAKLKKMDGFGDVHDSLSKSLKPHQRDIANALVVEQNRAKAEAIEVKHTIEKLKKEGKQDEIVDQLKSLGSSADKRDFGAGEKNKHAKHREDVLREMGKLYHKEKRGPKKKTLNDKEAKQLVKDQLNRTVHDYRTRQNRKMSPATKHVVDALVDGSPQSAKARAALINYELQRKGRKRLENIQSYNESPQLKAALENPDLKSPDDKVRAQAQAQVEHERKKQEKMMAHLASLQGMTDADALKDPNKVQQFVVKKTTSALGGGKDARRMAKSLGGPSLDPVGMIHHAIAGSGTREEVIKAALRGKSPKEIAKLKADYKKTYGVSLDTALFGGTFPELSGKEALEMKVLLFGQPSTDKEMIEFAKHRLEIMNQGTGLLADAAVNDAQRKHAIESHQKMKDMVSAYEKKHGKGSAFDKDGNFRGDWRTFQNHAQQVSQGAEGFEREIERAEEKLTMGIMILGAIAAVALTVLTGGLAAPAVAALLTGVATMTAKSLMRGDGYGWEEMGVDAAMTVVDVATARIGTAAKLSTQGVKTLGKAAGKAAIRGAITGGISSVAQTAMTDGVWDDGVGKGLGKVAVEGVKGAAMGAISAAATEGFTRSGIGKKLMDDDANPALQALGGALSGGVSGVTSSLTGSAFDAVRGTHKGGLLGALKAAGKQGLTDVISGAAEGAAEAGRSKYISYRHKRAYERLVHGTSSDQSKDLQLLWRLQRAVDPYSTDKQAFLAKTIDDIQTDRRERIARGDDQIKLLRQAELNDMKETNPGVDDAQLAAQLDARIQKDQADYAAKLAWEGQARAQLAADLPGELGELVDLVQLRQVTDEEMMRLAGDSNVDVFPIYRDGRVELVVRKGVPPSALIGQGARLLHVVQSEFSVARGTVSQDVPMQWDGTSASQKLQHYSAHLELELHTQRHKIAQLERAIGQTDNPKERAALMQALAESTQVLGALQAKQDRLNALSVDEINAMQNNNAALPDFLQRAPQFAAELASLSRTDTTQTPTLSNTHLVSTLGKTASPVDVSVTMLPRAQAYQSADGQLSVVTNPTARMGTAELAARVLGQLSGGVVHRGKIVRPEQVVVNLADVPAANRAAVIDAIRAHMAANPDAVGRVKLMVPDETLDASGLRRSLGEELKGVVIRTDDKGLVVSFDPVAPTPLQRMRIGRAIEQGMARQRLQDPEARANHAEQLIGALPKRLEQTPVQVDPQLAGNTVKVHYDVDEQTGLVKNIRVEAGPLATPEDVALHVQTIKTLKRYAGMQGKVRRLLNRLGNLFTLHGKPGPGTLGFEARLEVKKLQSIIDARLKQLGGAHLDEMAQLRLQDEVNGLRQQLAAYEAVIGSFERGRGYVAMAAKTDAGKISERVRELKKDLKADGIDRYDKLLDDYQAALEEYRGLTAHIKKYPGRYSALQMNAFRNRLHELQTASLDIASELSSMTSNLKRFAPKGTSGDALDAWLENKKKIRDPGSYSDGKSILDELTPSLRIGGDMYERAQKLIKKSGSPDKVQAHNEAGQLIIEYQRLVEIALSGMHLLPQQAHQINRRMAEIIDLFGQGNIASSISAKDRRQIVNMLKKQLPVVVPGRGLVQLMDHIPVAHFKTLGTQKSILYPSQRRTYRRDKATQYAYVIQDPTTGKVLDVGYAKKDAIEERAAELYREQDLVLSFQQIKGDGFDAIAFENSVHTKEIAPMTEPKTPEQIRTQRQEKQGNWSVEDVAQLMNAQLQNVTPRMVQEIISSFGEDAALAMDVLSMASGYASIEGFNVLAASVMHHAEKKAINHKIKVYAPGGATLADNLLYMDAKGAFTPHQQDWHKHRKKESRFKATETFDAQTVVILDEQMLSLLRTNEGERTLDGMIEAGCSFVYPQGWDLGLNPFNATTTDAIKSRVAGIIDGAKQHSGDGPVEQAHILKALSHHEQLAAISAKGATVHMAGPEQTMAHTAETIARQLSGYAGVTSKQIEVAISRYIASRGVLENDAMARRLLTNMLGYTANVSGMRKIAQLFKQHIDEQVTMNKDNVYVYLREKRKSFGLLGMMYASLYNQSSDKFFHNIRQFVDRIEDRSVVVLLLDDVAASGKSLFKALWGYDTGMSFSKAPEGLFGLHAPEVSNEDRNAAKRTYDGEVLILPVIGTDMAQGLFVEAGQQIFDKTAYKEAQKVNALFSEDPQGFIGRLSVKERAVLKALFDEKYLGYGEAGLNMAFAYMGPNNNNLFFSELLARYFIVNRNQEASKRYVPK